MRWIKWAMPWCLSSALLCGCGGGAGGAAIDGVWSGPGFAAVITPDGEVWGYYTDAQLPAGEQVTLVNGDIWTDSSMLAGKLHTYPRGVAAAAGVRGSASSHQAMAGVFDVCCSLDPNGKPVGRYQAPIAALYSPSSTDVPQLSWLPGVYRTSSGVTFAVDGAGRLSGQGGSCAFAGTVEPSRDGVNYFRLSLDFGASEQCEFIGPASGVLVWTKDAQFAVLANGQAGVVYRLAIQ